jgi:hypothetical protein
MSEADKFTIEGNFPSERKRKISRPVQPLNIVSQRLRFVVPKMLLEQHTKMRILLPKTDPKQMYKLVFRNSLALLYYIGDSLKPRRPSQSWVLSHERRHLQQ